MKNDAVKFMTEKELVRYLVEQETSSIDTFHIAHEGDLTNVKTQISSKVQFEFKGVENGERMYAVGVGKELEKDVSKLTEPLTEKRSWKEIIEDNIDVAFLVLTLILIYQLIT